MRDEKTRIRILTLLNERGKRWVEVYSKLGMHKTKASLILNGIVIPPLWQRVAIAKELNVDTSVIWEVPQLVSAYDLENQESTQ